MTWLESILLIWLIFIIYQDLKYRSILWFLFPVGLAIALIYGLQNALPFSLIKNTALNYFFITVQFLLVSFYFVFLRKIRLKQLKHYFGMGDMLFLLVVAVIPSPLNFILYLVFSFFIIFMGYSVFFIIKKRIDYKIQIPLAGLMSVLFVLLLCTGRFFNINVFSDSWIIKLLNHAG